MIRKHKIYSRPKKAFEAQRIKDENKILEDYGLKNKREVWKVLAKVNYYRRRAMELAEASHEEQKEFFSRLNALGLNVHSISDVLALKIDDILKRRLPSVLVKRGFANTMYQARQYVVHKKVRVGEQIINIPSYLVPTDKEHSIKVEMKMPEKKGKKEEVANE